VPGLSRHVDDFTLLRYVVKDLPDAERDEIGSHVDACRECRRALSELGEIETGLRRLSSAGLLGEPPGEVDLPARDPFRSRPSAPRKPRRERRASIPLEASKIGASVALLQRRLMDSFFQASAAVAIESIDLREAEHRFALLYGLQETGRRIAEDPRRALVFAEAAIRKLRLCSRRPDAGFPEQVLPWVLLWGQAHVLAAQSYLWTKDFEHAGSSLRVAYRAFGLTGDETNLAIVELNESQRRSFIGRGRSARILARRARGTFEDRGLDDLAAQALVTEGLAFYDLDMQEEAVAAYRLALPVFERAGLWSNYVGALNSLATSLTKLGRLDEARAECARALRRFSSREHRSWQGFLRIGIAELLHSAGRFQEGAHSAAAAGRVFSDSGLRANALIAWLLEIDCWAKQGNGERARARLESLVRAVERDEASVTRTVRRELEAALHSPDPRFRRLASLRTRLVEQIPRASSRS
jgi:tetratricopeptide (TPR) repeat protein